MHGNFHVYSSDEFVDFRILEAYKMLVQSKSNQNQMPLVVHNNTGHFSVNEETG